jgi:YD repeat-containing protein
MTAKSYANCRLSDRPFHGSVSHNQISQISYGYDVHGRQNALTDARAGTTSMSYNDADLVDAVTTPVPGPGQSAQVTRTYYNKLLQATNTVQPDNSSLYTSYYPTGLRKRTYGAREFPVEYSYDYAGRVQTMTTWRNYPSQPAVTTWNYSSTRGWLDNKRYPDAGSGSLGPDYLYSAAGKLRERTWARGNPRLKTTYAYNIAGDLETIDYADSTPDVAYGYNRRGRQSSVSQNGSAAASWTYNDLGNVLSETNSTGLLSGQSVTNGYDQYLRRTNVVLLGSGSTTASTRQDG